MILSLLLKAGSYQSRIVRKSGNSINQVCELTAPDSADAPSPPIVTTRTAVNGIDISSCLNCRRGVVAGREIECDKVITSGKVG